MRMKVIFFTFWLFTSAFGQSEITWSGTFDIQKCTAKLTATLGEGWHVYSMNVNEMAGPVATRINLEENKRVEVKAKVKEPEPLVSYDRNFEAELQYFEKTVTFEQELKIKKSTQLKYTVTYMICNDHTCYPPVDETIVIAVKK